MQIGVRVDRELLAEVDDLVERGDYESRAAAMRAGLEVIAELERRRRTDQAVLEGYRRIPPDQVEKEESLASIREAVVEEPW